MKLKHIAAASLAALVSTAGFAATLTETSYIDAPAFVWEFSGKQIALNDGPSYMFTLDAMDTDFSTLSGSYFITGGISSAKFTVTAVTLDGNPWTLTSGAASDLNLGTMSIGPATSIALVVTGTRDAAGNNFNGQLVLTPVPEPETYALMLAGLGAIGFIASRRKSRA
jgi:hypothetical protein